MDYKYIEQLLERYFNAETSLEEESILRTFFRQENIPAEMEPWRALFTAEAEDVRQLGDDFDARIMAMIADSQDEADETPQTTYKAREIRLTQRLMPLFKAAAVVAIILTIGGALQAPWDKSWNGAPVEYAELDGVDTVSAVIPIQAENISDMGKDTTAVFLSDTPAGTVK